MMKKYIFQYNLQLIYEVDNNYEHKNEKERQGNKHIFIKILCICVSK